MDEESIFATALQKQTPRERDLFLEGVCAANPGLREEIESLLRAHAEAGEFLQTPALEPTAKMEQPESAEGGTSIGPYKLLQKLGEGGMGVVYMAEQTAPVRRRVALKIIKPGMDSRNVIARFEAERQALALMDHPNIAKVLDAATAETGRPYFVMELVKGVPLTDYCDEQHLSLRERLALFVPICQAVQHAHQKGIIHRDLKPSNVLVALYDGAAVPKVIDFGVAKATSQQLTDKTMFTQLGQVVGTLEYMSPEQAQVNQLDVDTRSDIYSLGVLLYELLTGATPFDRQRLRTAALDEMMRIIREEEPPRPSLRLSTIDTLASVAANRRIEPQRLRTSVRGELDWIVMKALEKDRGRRYDTASSFAADIQHYLNDEPVVACPPSASYRCLKFARRNKGPVVAIAAVTLTLIAGICGTTLGLLRANRNATVAKAEANKATVAKERLEQTNAQLAASQLEIQQANADLNEKNRLIGRTLMAQALAAAMSGNNNRARHALKAAQESGASEAEIALILGVMNWWSANDPEAAVAHLRRVLEIEPENVAATANLAFLALQQGATDEFFDMRRKLNPLKPQTPVDYLMKSQVTVMFSPANARRQTEQALAMHDSPIGHVLHAVCATREAFESQDFERAEAALQEVAEARTILGGDNNTVEAIRLMALNHLIILKRSREENTETLVQMAEQCAAGLLARETLHPMQGAQVAFFYDRTLADLDRAEQVWRRVVANAYGDYWQTTYAAFRLRRGGLESALAAFDTTKVRTFFGQESELIYSALHPDGRKRARQAWREFGESRPAVATLVAVLLGETDAAKQAIQTWRTRSEGYWEVTLRYLVDELSDQEYIGRMRGHNTGKYALMGIKSLARGKLGRAKASEYFRKSVAADRYFDIWFYLSKGFLAELDRDPAWPQIEIPEPAQF